MNRYLQMRLSNKGKGDFRAEDNTIWIYDVIASDDMEAAWWGGIAPSAFIAALAKTTGPVTLRINSPGGSVFGAQAMVAAMRAHQFPITAKIDSLAASAASVIAANCSECVMVPGSMQMIHRAWGMSVGHCEDMRQTAGLLEKIDGLIADAYTDRAAGKHSREEFDAMMAAETWFTPEEAVAAGLCDRIAEENTQRPASLWDLSAFLAAPQVEDLQDEEKEAEPPIPETSKDDSQKARAIRVARLNARLLTQKI
jgi:ATP-dependent protease ClpP protease subunit